MRDALLVPRAAVPYLDVEVPAHVHRAELAPVRREALDVLAAGWRSAPRALLGLTAWAGSVVAAFLFALAPSLTAPWGVAAAVSGGLLLPGAAWLAVVVLRAGRRITGAAAGWLQVPAVGASGRDAGPMYAVLRRQVALSLASGAAAIALLVAAAALLPGWAGAATLVGASPAGPSAADPWAMLAVLTVAGMASAVVAVGTFGGVSRILQAAWARPTVGLAPGSTGAVQHLPTVGLAPGSSAAAQHLPTVGRAPGSTGAAQHRHTVGSAPGPAPVGEHPPTVAIDLSGAGQSALEMPWAEPAAGQGAGYRAGSQEPRAAEPGPSGETEAPRGEAEAPRGEAEAPRGETEAPGARAASPAFEVVLGTGRTLRPGATLVGRSPQARPSDAVDHVLVLSDQTVTKTHAVIIVDPDAVRVVDRASTNGTLVEAADGSLSRCRPWEVTTVRAPAMIHLGRTRILVRPLVSHTSLEVA